MRAKHSDLADSTNRSAKAFKLGLHAGRREAFPMRPKEGFPRHLRPALRCRLDAAVLEDRFDRVAGNLVADALQPAADPSVAPRRVLGRHPHDERRNVRLRARTTGASRVRAVVFLGHKAPIPTQDRLRCDDTGHTRQPAPAEDVAFHRQAASLVVGEAQASRSVRGAEDAVLHKQIVNDRLLRTEVRNRRNAERFVMRGLVL